MRPAPLVFRVFSRTMQRTPAGPPLAGLAPTVLLALMNGSAAASTALTCISSTLGVVIPPSLVLILLGDAMLRAHTEAVNIAGRRGAERIINRQDVCHRTMIPVALLLVFFAFVTWMVPRRAPRAVLPPAAVTRVDIVIALSTTVFITALFALVAFWHLYAIEAAATGGVAQLNYGLLSSAFSREIWREVLHDTMAVTGALFALLPAATVFTLIVRAFGTETAGSPRGLPGSAAISGCCLPSSWPRLRSAHWCSMRSK